MKIQKAAMLGLVIGISFSLFLPARASAQYAGGGTGSGSPSYGYGSGKAIGLGVGAAAAGAGVLYLALHHASSVTGCVQTGNDGLSLVDEKTKKSYVLLPGGADLLPGERVELRGKKAKAGATAQTFKAKKLVKNFGTCGMSSASTTSLLRSPSERTGQN